MSAVEVIQKLSEIAGPFGIGRDIHVGDTIIGIKGRVGFEAAAPSIIIKAHHTLENTYSVSSNCTGKSNWPTGTEAYCTKGNLWNPSCAISRHS